MNAIAKIVRLRPAEGQSEILGRKLMNLVDATRTEPGCVKYDLYRDDDGNWIVVEIWRNAAALNEHRAAPHTVALVKG